MDREDNNLDLDNAEMFLSISSNSTLVLDGIRVIVLLVSLWKPEVCKSYFYIHMLYHAFKHMTPVDYG